MIWLPIDCHAHSTFSDGKLDVQGVIEQARARGARPSIADHISRDVATSLDSPDAVARYLDALDGHPVARGGEFCWHDSLWRDLPSQTWERFTHRLGSLHGIWLPDGTVVHMFRDYPEGLSADAYLEAHIDNLERLAREMPVDILSHPTLMPAPLRKTWPEELWTEEREERVVEALHRAGIAFEISNRYRPHERLVRRAVARGVRIALGSDGHTAEQVGDIAWPLALARSLGVPDAELFDPFVHGSRIARSAA